MSIKRGERELIKPKKRMGANDAETRARLVEAALEILSSSGIAAVTAGRVAEAVGLKRQIVHYYFGTIDDLLAEVVRHSYGHIRKQVEKRLKTETVAEVIWKQFRLTVPTAIEFTVLALRSESVGKAYRECATDLRTLLAERISAGYAAAGIEPEIEPEDMVVIMQMSAQYLGVEASLGIRDGYPEAQRFLMSAFTISSPVKTQKKSVKKKI